MNLGDFPILKVNGTGRARLAAVMSLSPGFPAHGYVTEPTRFVLFQYANSPGATPFPTPLLADKCADLAWEWLQSVAYPQEPDHDGDNGKGWLCSTGDWGEVNGYDYHSFLSIEPHWLMYGK